MSTSATAGAPLTGAGTVGLLDGLERLMLGVRLTIAMLAAGLLVLALAWEFLAPAGQPVATMVAGAAAALVAIPVLAAAWQSFRRPTLHGITDRLIALALIAAWADGDLMTAAVLPIVMILGHVLEERSLLGSREAIRALLRLAETTARRIRVDGSFEVVQTRDLRLGDRIELRAGDRIPADGVVRRGSASLDTASLTGESLPVEVREGDRVLAGSIDTDGRLEITVTGVGGATTLGKIIALMRTAEQAKPPVTRLLERYAGQYLLLVLMLAAGTWFASGDVAATLAVLVASCPCALVLAAPATSIAAIAVAARHGILIKGSAFLENLTEVNSVVFDKTGTLTHGELTLTGVVAVEAEADPRAIVAIAGALGSASSHPVSRAAARACPAADRADVADLREAGGFGVTGTLFGERAAFGRPELLMGLGIPIPAVPAHDGPVAGVTRGERFLGWLLFADQPRQEAEAALADLRRLGLEWQVLLTGDRARVARRIGSALGLTDITAEALPEQKMQRVLLEIAAGYHPMVVGDGINDTLALKAGAIGMAMGGQGSDVALASADVVLMSSDLRRLGTAIRLSWRCRRTIHVNVAIGLGWTVVLAGAAAAGLLGAQGAIVAALLHNLSTLLGLANAGRLLLFDETGPEPTRASAPVPVAHASG